MRTGTLIASAISLVVLAGCASMEPGLGFEDVRQSVADRTGMRVHWNTGAAEDREVAEAISALLERELAAEEAVQLALLNNRELQAVYEELNLAQADLVQAGLLRNPVFSGELRFGVDTSGTAVVLDLTQDFLSLLWMPLRKGRAQAQFEAAKLRVTASVVDMAGQVRSAYYEYVAAAQTTEMRRTVLEATRASYELAKRVRAAGNSRELDVASERDLFEQAKLDLALAEENELVLREQLTAMMGLWGEQAGWRAASRLPAVPEDHLGHDIQTLERRAVEASLDLEVARREIEVAARTLGISRPFSWLTDTVVGATGERDLDGGWSVGPTLSVPVPLFDQGQAAIGRAEAQLRQAGGHYYARAVEIRSRARAAGTVLNSARNRARYYEAVVLPLREQIVHQTQLQYNAMQIPAFQLLEAKRNQIEGGADYIEALRDYWVARTRVEQILGGRVSAFEGSGPASPSDLPHTAIPEDTYRPLQHRHTGARPVASPE
ncbi:MAG: TolC family protein [Phycisphaeraceae bacterium]|jgi:outer membrane protein, heavy metal efflux system|nr:MAG: TolC family protein [Phycisphaeraceae bacterium]